MDILNRIDVQLNEWSGEKASSEGIDLMVDELKSNVEELESAMKKMKDTKGLKQLKVVKREISKL